MTPLQQAAQAVIDRWETTFAPSLQRSLTELRKALDAELHQSVEPVLYIDATTLAMDNAHVGAWKPGHELDGNLPLYLHPPQLAKPKTAGERAELIAAHQELNMSNYGPDDVDALNDWANRAYDMLEADVSLINEGNKAQQSKQVPMTDEEIDAIGVDYQGSYRVLRKFARAIEAHHGIGGEA